MYVVLYYCCLVCIRLWIMIFIIASTKVTYLLVHNFVGGDIRGVVEGAYHFRKSHSRNVNGTSRSDGYIWR